LKKLDRKRKKRKKNRMKENLLTLKNGCSRFVAHHSFFFNPPPLPPGPLQFGFFCCRLKLPPANTRVTFTIEQNQNKKIAE
jgi:hypothetical protein